MGWAFGPKEVIIKNNEIFNVCDWANSSCECYLVAITCNGLSDFSP